MHPILADYPRTGLLCRHRYRPDLLTGTFDHLAIFFQATSSGHRCGSHRIFVWRYRPPHHAQQPHRAAWVQEGCSIHWLPHPRRARHCKYHDAPSNSAKSQPAQETFTKTALPGPSLLALLCRGVPYLDGLLLPVLLFTSQYFHLSTHTDTSKERSKTKENRFTDFFRHRCSLARTGSAKRSRSTPWPSSMPHLSSGVCRPTFWPINLAHSTS